MVWFSVAAGLGAQARVPFVGCASDGQVGPKPAPGGAAQLVAVDAKEARRFAYYKTELGPGVLAPRGWYCYGTYGSGGASTLVTPEPIPPRKLFGESDLRFTGTAVVASFVYSGTF